MLAVQVSSIATETKMLMVRKTPRYRGAVDEVVPNRMYPTAATVAARAQNGPRTLKRSESQATMMMVKKTSR